MAKSGVKVRGFDLVKSNLSREIHKIKGRTLKGLIEAQIVIRRDMSSTSPTIPIYTRNLEHSYFCVTSKGDNIAEGDSSFEGKYALQMEVDHNEVVSSAKAIAKAKLGAPFIIMGFSANYAVFVHEMSDVNWSKAGSGRKFFQKPIYRNRKEVLIIIADNAKIQ